MLKLKTYPWRLEKSLYMLAKGCLHISSIIWVDNICLQVMEDTIHSFQGSERTRPFSMATSPSMSASVILFSKHSHIHSYTSLIISPTWIPHHHPCQHHPSCPQKQSWYSSLITSTSLAASAFWSSKHLYTSLIISPLWTSHHLCQHHSSCPHKHFWYISLIV